MSEGGRLSGARVISCGEPSEPIDWASANIIPVTGCEPISIQRNDGQFEQATKLSVVRDTDGTPRIEPFCRGGHPRVTVISSIRRDYAAHYAIPCADQPCWMAGGKTLRMIAETNAGTVEASEIASAIADLLVVVDEFLLFAKPCVLGGIPFPDLAFAEFVELLLLWPAQVIAGPTTDATVKIVRRDVFDVPERYHDLVTAMLARDWQRFVVHLEHLFVDPVWAGFQRARYPGHAELFLSSIRRRRARGRA